MLVSVIVGGAILIGSIVLFGPIGLVGALVLAVLGGWIFGKSNPQELKAHRENVDEDLKSMFHWW
jgi:hypothetical protein